MISINKSVLQQMKQIGENAYPDEACGILTGAPAGADGVKKVLRLYPVVNTAEERYHRFAIEPERMLEAEEKAARAGEEILGIFHTHPDVAAVPSEFDRTHALPLYSYVIGSVRHGAMKELRSWEIDLSDYQFREEIIWQSDC